MAEKDENGGYKFAIAVLAASGSIFYATYNYLQNTPIREESFFLFCLVLATVFIPIIFFLAYLLIEGYLMETKNDDITKILNKSAQVLYIFALLFFAATLFLFIYISLYKFATNLFTEVLQEVGILSIVSHCVMFFLPMIAVLLGYVLVVYYRGEHRSWSHFLHLFSNPLVKNVGMCWIGLGIIVVAVIFFGCCAMSYTPLHGHVTIYKESIYYINNTPIPVSIQVTGPNTEIFVALYTKNSSNSSALVSVLVGMEPDFFGQESDDVSKRKLYSNNVSVGNYLGNGKYCVFINTTNLPAGYYELMCIRKGFWKETCEGKSFYLVNKNHNYTGT